MKKILSTKKTKTEAAPQKKPAKAGPVELSPADLKKVSGGLPRGGWAPAKTSTE